ncbi:MAG: hypothetical protein ACYDBW_10470 [Sulfuricaulis sp.]
MKFKTKFAVGLLSLLLLLVEAGALADQMEHQLHKPDKPCAQCIFANHVGKTAVAAPLVFSAPAPEIYSPPLSLSTPRRQEIRAYTARAPPLDSEI